MEERDFYDERQETRKATLNCPHCHSLPNTTWAGLSAPRSASCPVAPTSVTAPSLPRPAPTWSVATISSPARTFAVASASRSPAFSLWLSSMSRFSRNGGTDSFAVSFVRTSVAYNPATTP